MDEIVKTEYKKIGKRTTICLLTLQSGFEIVGNSLRINLDDTQKLVGEKSAEENALKKYMIYKSYLQQIEQKQKNGKYNNN